MAESIFTDFSTLLQRSMPYLSPTQAADIAASSVGNTGQTWAQLFDQMMSDPNNSAHVSGAANIYYSGNITINGKAIDAIQIANTFAESSGGQ